MSRILAKRFAGRLLPWLLLAAAAAMTAGSVKHPAALTDMWRPWGEIGTLSAVMTAIVLTGGIDLSVGSMAALAAVVMGLAWHDFGWPLPCAVFAALATGLAAGAGNALLIHLRIAPLVATLVTMACYAGLAMSLSQGRRIPGLPDSLAALGQGDWLGLPTQAWLLAAAIAALYVLVHHTRMGRYIYAMGDNRRAAECAAVPVHAVEAGLYVISGLAAAIVGVMLACRSGAVVPTAGSGMELQAIACVVVGGTRITGGEGGVGRTLLGVAVMSTLDMALQLVPFKLSVPWSAVPWQFNAPARLVVVGVLLIALAVLNQRLSQTELERTIEA